LIQIADFPLFRTQKLKIQNDIYEDIFHFVDTVSTTEVYKNEALKTYKLNIHLTGNFKAHKGMVAAPCSI